MEYYLVVVTQTYISQRVSHPTQNHIIAKTTPNQESGFQIFFGIPKKKLSHRNQLKRNLVKAKIYEAIQKHMS